MVNKHAKYNNVSVIFVQIYFHGENLGALHEFFDTDILPESLGGSLVSSEDECDSFMMQMLEKDDYYKGIENAKQNNRHVTKCLIFL